LKWAKYTSKIDGWKKQLEALTRSQADHAEIAKVEKTMEQIKGEEADIANILLRWKQHLEH
jgi:hypothetical protein